MTDLQITEEDIEAGQLAADVFSRYADPDHITAVEAATGYDDELWAELASSGILGLPIPEEHGGIGLGPTAAMLALVGQGRSVAPVPLWETLAVAVIPLARLAGETEIARTWLPRAAAGEAVLTGAWAEWALDWAEPVRVTGSEGQWRLTGHLGDVPSGERADAIVVPARVQGSPALFLVEASGLERTASRTTDHRTVADLTLDDTPAELITRDAAQVAEALNWAWLGLCFLQLGVSRSGLDQTAAYVTERHQFGTPLGTFQAVAHQIADCAIAVEAMELTAHEALYRIASGLPEEGSVHTARWWATREGTRVARTCQHLFAGNGADITSRIHRHFLWSTRLANTLGSASWHQHRLGLLVAAGQAPLSANVDEGRP